MRCLNSTNRSELLRKVVFLYTPVPTLWYCLLGGLLSEGGVASALLITSLVDAHSVRTVQLDEEEGGLIQDMTTPIKKCVEVKVTLSSLSGPALRNVTMCVNSQLPLTTHPSHFTLPEVSSTQDHAPLVLTVVATPTLLPTSTHLTLSATYTSNEGMTCVHA